MPVLIVLALGLAAIIALVLWRRTVTIIFPPMVGLLYKDGRFERELPPGRYAWFDPSGRRKVVTLSLAEQVVQLAETTVLSKDRFSFRIGLTPVLRIVEPRLFSESQPAIEQPFLGHFLPFAQSQPAMTSLLASAALEFVTSKTLAEIFADPASISNAVQARLAEAIPGARVERVLLTAINLPPETRKMFTDVERAKMEAQAGLERARGEHASLRLLANAARLMTDNPALANLRLLQAVESSKGATTIIVGNPASLSLGAAGEVGPAGTK